MTTDELRKAYLDFFKKKDHRVYPSDSLIPIGDASLLFTGAGMNQFKSYFLGLKKDVKRAASCQKCLRTADLERVGKTAYHHSFFEMLGNFSFGDYFKEEAITWGWEFVTKVLKLPQEKLWVSVYEEDDEAFSIWKNKINLPESKIVRMGPEDNFWPANAPKDGPNGPCGPCSEIYVGSVPGKGVEIWNLVFTQFDRQSDGSLKPLPQKNIDTGMGLERTASVLQGVESNFDTDNFIRMRAELKRLLKSGSNERAHENAILDHIRAAAFSIADGALPSNEGRGYVIRKIIRLASDHLTKAGAIQAGTLHKLVPAVISVYGSAYPEIVEREKTILGIIENEEKAYLEVLKTQLPKFDQELQQIVNISNEEEKNSKIAELAFKYYDTFGLPFELIVAGTDGHGLKINHEHFKSLMEKQKKRSRESSKITGEIFSKDDSLALIEGLSASKFLGYEKTETTSKLLKSTDSLLIFDETPFYAEAGGQIGDTGEITGKNFRAKVVDTKFIDKCIAHKVEILEGTAKEGEGYQLKVDIERRADIMKNHTATHLLHAALRKVLGEHVKQSGSLVAPDYLRFDFTHFKQVDAESLQKIEALVNEEIKKNIRLDKQEMNKDEAVQKGAIAFFGEKYGDKVRVVTIGGFSKELCGGTHLESTGQIESFKITSESSIQAGVRRITAVTGRWAENLVRQKEKEIQDLCRTFGAVPESLGQEIHKRSERVSALKNRLVQNVGEKIKGAVVSGLSRATEEKGVKLVVMTADGANMEIMKPAADYLKIQPGSCAMLIASRSEDKVTLAVAGSGDFIQRGFNAGEIVKKITAVVDGKGGGRPEFAIGGGKNVARTAEAIALGKKEIYK